VTCRNNLELNEVILVQPDDSDMSTGTLFCTQYVKRLEDDNP
jgi:hypothetical protein